MATSSVGPRPEATDMVRALRQYHEKIDSAEGLLVLDVSALRRIDSQVLTALEELADAAKRKNVTLALRGLDVSVYKVLKLLKLSSQFSYLE